MTARQTDDRAVTLCHVSDFHLPLPASFPVYKLLSKRMLGYLNLKVFRGWHHHRASFMTLLAEMRRTNPDATVLTGDVANLSLAVEFNSVRALLDDAGFTPDNLLIVPGNHDRYTPGAARRKDFDAAMHPWIGDGPDVFPLLRPLGPIALIGLDSAVWRGPHRSAGRLHRAQLSRLEDLLHNRLDGRRPVVAIHHPPFRLTDSPLKQYLSGLDNYPRLLEILAGHRAVVLHGHIHRRSDVTINDTRILGVPSASNESADPARTMAFHTLRFDPDGRFAIHATCYHAGADRFETIALPGDMQ